MKAKLIKDHQEYMLINDERFVIATTDVSMLEVTDKMKLSKQNCDEIFGVVNVDKWVAEKVDNRFNENDGYHKVVYVEGLVEGFNKAIELNKDKVFTLEDMLKAYEKGASFGTTKLGNTHYFDELIQSLQQPTEIEVMIEMVKTPDAMFQFHDVPYSTPKLDSQGCLILTKKI
jgi:hypothetical protein